jgi:hypothetical protein
LKRLKLPADLSYLSLACLFSVILHGLAESSMVIGGTLNPMLLGLGVGLSDRLREFSVAPRPTRASRLSNFQPAGSSIAVRPPLPAGISRHGS